MYLNVIQFRAQQVYAANTPYVRICILLYRLYSYDSSRLPCPVCLEPASRGVVSWYHICIYTSYISYHRIVHMIQRSKHLYVSTLTEYHSQVTSSLKGTSHVHVHMFFLFRKGLCLVAVGCATTVASWRFVEVVRVAWYIIAHCTHTCVLTRMMMMTSLTHPHRSTPTGTLALLSSSCYPLGNLAHDGGHARAEEALSAAE